MVNGGSNVCVTGDLGILLDVVNIDPIQISVALEGAPASLDNCITKRGLLPLTMTDGSCYYQQCYYCTNLIEMIISPSAILATSDVFVQWQQIGYKDPTIPGNIRFMSHDGLASMHFSLQCRDGLYYCDTDVYAVNQSPVHIHCCRTVATPLTGTPAPPPHQPPSKFKPTLQACQVESEVWALQFGLPGEGQLDVLPLHVDGTLPLFEYHPFHLIDFKEQAHIRKHPAVKLPNKSNLKAQSSSWILVSCRRPPTTTTALPKQRTALSHPMMVTVHTSLLSMAPLVIPGPSSQSQRSPPLPSALLSFVVLETKQGLSERTRVANLHGVTSLSRLC
jgi:hypothetical protein